LQRESCLAEWISDREGSAGGEFYPLGDQLTGSYYDKAVGLQNNLNHWLSRRTKWCNEMSAGALLQWAARKVAMEREQDRREWVLTALEQYEGRLLRYAHRLLGDLDAARDIVQFAFLRLCDARPKEVEGRLAQWLFTVCRNKSLDTLRSKGGVAVVGAADRSELGQDVDQLSREADPASAAEDAELHGLLLLLVETLPPSQREALDLWAEGFSYTEIAAISGRQEGHVRVLVHRGLKALREHPQVRELMSETQDEPAASGARAIG
jgi:RNA polymerase sigma-70 factor (ECF subfamily)